jgi:putative radical SAM enzyme (TIGR03279 family)
VSPRATYGGRVPATCGGGVIRSVDADSPGQLAGIVPGDVLVSVDGAPLRDIIDWQWLSDGDDIDVVVRHQSTTRSERLARKAGESWGVEFCDAVFDGVRTCRNRCAFCFMAQLPKGLRRALSIRDDDFRLSFLQGNFVTLTNLSDADVSRITEQRLSPLYVSLHAVDPKVRARLVCAREDRALERFDELLESGIDVHVQIVLVPGVNDGEELERSLCWLAEREGVLSVGVVPLGFTAHQTAFSASYEGDSAAAVLDQIGPWQEAFRLRDGVTWVYCADEFYLQAHRNLPPAEEYDDFPQYENGIGIARTFLDEAADLAPELETAAAALGPALSLDLVTGELSAPVLERALERAPALAARADVLPVPNRFFGGNVSVTGLLTAADLIPAIRASRADVVAVPDVVANSDGLLLDDIPAAELGIRTGRDVRLVSCDAGGLLSLLRDVAANPPEASKE